MLIKLAIFVFGSLIVAAFVRNIPTILAIIGTAIVGYFFAS